MTQPKSSRDMAYEKYLRGGSETCVFDPRYTRADMKHSGKIHWNAAWNACEAHHAKRMEAAEGMGKALNGWMESYQLMADKTDGILRDSLRGFFLNCPWNSKHALEAWNAASEGDG